MSRSSRQVPSGAETDVKGAEPSSLSAIAPTLSMQAGSASADATTTQTGPRLLNAAPSRWRDGKDDLRREERSTDLRARRVGRFCGCGLLPLAFASCSAVRRVQAQQLHHSPSVRSISPAAGARHHRRYQSRHAAALRVDSASASSTPAFNPATWNGITQASSNSRHRVRVLPTPARSSSPAGSSHCRR